ncbi:hypothetical protein HK405_010684, partial [Cladochytrium tenue]
MATVVERTPSGGVVYRAAETRTVPQMDLLSALFESERGGSKEDTRLHIDAEDPTKAITKAQLRPLVKQAAHTLRHRLAVRPGDVVLVISTGHWMLPTVFYATIAAGAVFSSSTPGSTPKELAVQMRLVEAVLLVCSAETRETALAAAREVGLPASRVVQIGDGRGFELFEQGSGAAVPLSAESLEWERVRDPEVLENSTICILFSSGTTGPPKGVRLSHTNVVGAASLVLDPIREWHDKYTRPRYEYRTLAHLPVAHIAGIQGYFVNPFWTGGSVFWMPRFDFAKFLAHAKAHRITSFFSVPPVFLLIAKSPAVTDHFDQVDMAYSGAAPMGKELQMAAQAKLGRGKAQLPQTWGLSETTGSITASHLGVPQDETGSVASLVANCQARIVDEDGKDVEPGQPGEIWVKGPIVTKGYWKNDEISRQSFVDGWFCTGDVAEFRNGVFYIVDRKKELIKYKAAQVAPAELEALLVSHPLILDAAVIGVPGEGTEVPR